MADLYVRSTDGSDSDDGTTWALAKAKIGGVAAIDVAGDTIWLSQNHNESSAATVNVLCAGTLESPSRILCGDDSVEPPTALATTAVCSTSVGLFDFTGSFYCYGIKFVSSGGANAGIRFGKDASYQVLEQCKLHLTANDNRPSITAGEVGSSGAQGFVRLVNSTMKFAHASQRINVNGAYFEWVGGGLESGTVSPSILLQLATDRQQPNCLLEGLDLSNGGTTMAIFGAATSSAKGVIRNCKLPNSWAGSLVSGTLRAGGRTEMYNCDSTDTNYRLWIEDYAGSITQDTGVYNDAGATDGTTRLSWKMAAAANAEYPTIVLRSPEIVRWNGTTGSSITCTVEIAHSSQGSGTDGVLNDDEIWLEVQYLGTAGYPLTTLITDCKADVLATAAAQTTSSAAWTGDSAGWDTQKLSVTFTPQETGFIHARVVVAKANATVYVDPLITVS